MDSSALLFPHVCLPAIICKIAHSLLMVKEQRTCTAFISHQTSLLFRRDLHREMKRETVAEFSRLTGRIGRYCVNEGCVFETADTKRYCPLEQQRLRRAGKLGLRCFKTKLCSAVSASDLLILMWIQFYLLCPEKEG